MSVTGTQLNPAKSSFVTIVGRKGSGKSVLAERFWDTYPYDRLVIDPTGDVATDATDLHAPLPARFPGALEDAERVSLRFVPDPGSDTYLDELDQAVGLAFYHRRTLLWIDEVAELTKANRTPPHFRRALHQGRHRDLSLLMCGPRPIDINPLVISQADFVFVFQLPNPKDRERVADNIGFPPREFDGLVNALPRYGFLRWDTRAQELTELPPLDLTKLRRARRNASRSSQKTAAGL